ncbi:hypothetical protein OU5_P0354 (plasmid) [Pseudomonas mandelii JR-1]|uniref:Uncharacterized protein n=1 Tax=Pseudomonas mandelii JR-1 TaxID=1147786 RepID=A0A024ELX3_9PSED|nr:hypothetical protein OU5_P0354 [Pseudomonas mandelii JR-1]
MGPRPFRYQSEISLFGLFNRYMSHIEPQERPQKKTPRSTFPVVYFAHPESGLQTTKANFTTIAKVNGL